MPNNKDLIIIDTELGEINLEDEKTVNDAVASVPVEDTTTKPNPVDDAGEDFEEYQLAWEAEDVEALEDLRAKHPEDARFNLHLQFLDDDTLKAQPFPEIKKAYNAVNKELGLDGMAEFNRLLEAGNKTKLKEYIDGLDDKHPAKAHMLTLLKYI